MHLNTKQQQHAFISYTRNTSGFTKWCHDGLNVKLTLTSPTLRITIGGLVAWCGVGSDIAIDDLTEGRATGTGRHLAIQSIRGWTGSWPRAQVCPIHCAAGGSKSTSSGEGIYKYCIWLYSDARQKLKHFCNADNEKQLWEEEKINRIEGNWDVRVRFRARWQAMCSQQDGMFCTTLAIGTLPEVMRFIRRQSLVTSTWWSSAAQVSSVILLLLHNIFHVVSFVTLHLYIWLYNDCKTNLYFEHFSLINTKFDLWSV